MVYRPANGLQRGADMLKLMRGNRSWVPVAKGEGHLRRRYGFRSAKLKIRP
jgi:hypothetical protein